jgi:hypothetical protein
MPYAMQPIEDVKDYFGEKIALYFAFIGQVHSMPSLHHSLRLLPFSAALFARPPPSCPSATLKRTVSAAACLVLQSSLLSAPLTTGCRAFTRALWHRQYTTMLYIPASMGLVLYLTQVTASQWRIVSFWFGLQRFVLRLDSR